MELTQILEWLLAWGLFLLAQSIFINGIYQAATGETKKRVDGSDEDSEMILYWLKKFFEQTKEVYIKYKGEEAKKINSELWYKYRSIEFIFWNESSNSLFFYHTQPSIEEKERLSQELRFYYKSIYKLNEIGRIEIYKIYEDYKYSKWIRKPIIQCIKCMASFWGGLTYWPVVLFLFGFNWLEVPVFFADMFCLTYLNWVLYLKAQTK